MPTRCNSRAALVCLASLLAISCSQKKPEVSYKPTSTDDLAKYLSCYSFPLSIDDKGKYASVELVVQEEGAQPKTLYRTPSELEHPIQLDIFLKPRDMSDRFTNSKSIFIYFNGINIEWDNPFFKKRITHFYNKKIEGHQLILLSGEPEKGEREGKVSLYLLFKEKE
jgi:hypothetical protein